MYTIYVENRYERQNHHRIVYEYRDFETHPIFTGDAFLFLSFSN